MAKLDRLHRTGRTSAAARPDPGSAAGGSVPVQGAGARLRTLLAAATVQDEAAARAALLEHAVGQLVPDEARILVALGASPVGAPGAAVVHIHSLTRTGLPGDPVLEHASTLGSRAGLALPGATPHYLRRLLALDLVVTGPEDPRLLDDYQALLAAPDVLAAMSRARVGGATPRVLRHTLSLSALGRALCGEAEGPGGPAEPA